MATPRAYLETRSQDAWLVNQPSQQFAEWVERRSQQIDRFSRGGALPVVLLAEANPIKFLAGWMAAGIAECPVCLGNPNWALAEWQQVLTLVQPDCIWAESFPAHGATSSTPLKQGWILIPTGGSSGQVRFAVHTWETLMASIEGFKQHFQVATIDSCCVLPLYHVSGLMQFLRSFTSGGRLAISSVKAIETGTLPEFDPTSFFLSLVPTQLQRLLQQPEQATWLRQFHTVLLGGAPAWHGLLEQARSEGIRLALTYGMTETASQVATLLPEQFLQGANHCGQVLPHATIAIGTESSTAAGQITIQARSLALGYVSPIAQQWDGIDLSGEVEQVRSLLTDDLGFLDEAGNLHVVGRSSHKIITGGENVFPVEVESALRETGLVADVCVLGVADATWGEVVAVVYVPTHSTVSVAVLQAALQSQLSRFKHPKRWVAVEQLPRNDQGKLDVVELRAIASTQTI